MEVRAQLKSLRISPRKVRLVANVVRGTSIQDARRNLDILVKRSSVPMLKLLNSAVANAKNNFKIVESNLYISEIFVDEGATFKRWMPRAMGRATEILKRTSHITIVLGELTTNVERMDLPSPKATARYSTNVERIDEQKDTTKRVRSHKQGISVKAAQTDTAKKMKTSNEVSKKKFQRRKVV
ncbi:50S ribosomal protein L22 [bacterium]|nr:MAG: 50S ribosomal protein L22 [bacterium]